MPDYRLTLAGFLGYRDPVTIDLDPLCYGIGGLNHVSPGEESNGAGKSSLPDGISWVIYGKTPRRVPATDDLINTSCDEMSGTFAAWGYEVSRSRKRESSQKITVTKGGVEVPGLRTVAEAQAFIDQHIMGMDYDDFVNFVYFTGVATQTFLSVDTDPGQRAAVISRYLRLSIYDDCRKEAGNRQRDCAARIGVLEADRLREVAVEEQRLKDLEKAEFDLSRAHASVDESQVAVTVANENVEFWRSVVDNMRPVVDAVSRAVEADTAETTAVESLNELVPPDPTHLQELRCLLSALQDCKPDALESQGLTEAQVIPGLEKELADLGDLGPAPSTIPENITRMNELGAKIKETNTLITSKNTDLRFAEKRMADLLAQRETALTCPACNAPVMLSEDLHSLQHFDLAMLDRQLGIERNLIQDLKGSLAQLDDDLAGYEGDRGDLQSLQNEWTEKNTVITKLTNAISKARRTVDQRCELVTRQIVTEESKIASFESVKAERQRVCDGAVEATYRARRVAMALADDFAKWLSMLVGDERDARSEWFRVREYGKIKVFFTPAHLKDAETQRDQKVTALATCQTTLATSEADLARCQERVTQYSVANPRLTEIDQRLSEERELVGHLVFWKDEFPAIRDRIVSKFLPLFEGATNRYLATLNVIYRVRFALTAETQKGTTVPRFNIRVWDGVDWRASHTYSSGQWGRVATAICFAFRELMLHGAGGGKDLFLCDETADRFDGVGLRLFIELVRGLGGLRLLVSHRTTAELPGLDQYITVERTAETTTLAVA